MSFEKLGLSAPILKALQDKGYSQPTPIQAQAIPPVLKGRDVLAAAQTGTGKTAGFTLPILERISQKGSSGKAPIRALILTPTRELAAQIYENIQDYSKYLNLKSSVVFGGVNINPQIQELRSGCDVLVATPGRLLDLHNQRVVNLSRVEMFVLDEADRMLDMGFIKDINRVIALLPSKHQTLLFSATFSADIKKLTEKFLNNPVTVEVAVENSTVDTVAQLIYRVDKAKKTALLSKLITEGDWQQVLVFSRTKHGADRLARKLDRAGIRASAIHGDKSQNQRTNALARFKSGEIKVLVATDIAARGIDIHLLPHVVNFDLPNSPEDYVHRIGRTGRAGSNGEAISLVCYEEEDRLRAVEKLIKKSIRNKTVEGFEPDMVQAVKDAVAKEKKPKQRFVGKKGGVDGGKPRANGKTYGSRKRKK